MKRVAIYGLIAGSVLVAGGAIAASQMDGPGDHGWKHHGHHDRAQMADHFFQDFDLNKDGKVTKAEVDQVNAQRFREVSGGAQAVTFDQFIAAREKDMREHEKEHFARMDKNGDGKLTQDEFDSRHDRMFDHMDKNKDGVITKDEVTPPLGDDHDGPPPGDDDHDGPPPPPR